MSIFQRLSEVGLAWLNPCLRTLLLTLLAGFVPATSTHADIAASTISAISPGNVQLGQTLDVTFTVEVVTPDQEYMDSFDVTLPSQWMINSLTPNAGGNQGICFNDAVASTSGQTIAWATPFLNDGCGPFGPGTHSFVANVTVDSCAGAPWSFPWNISGDQWGSPPHDTNGTYASIACNVGAATMRAIPTLNTTGIAVLILLLAAFIRFVRFW